MIVKFWGVRGSFPVSRKEILRYGGNTSCVSVQIGNKMLVIDAGMGAVMLGDALHNRLWGQEVTDIYFVLTHLHRDHLEGFPYFWPLYESTRRVHLLDYQHPKGNWSLMSMLDGIHYPMTPTSVQAPHHIVASDPMEYLQKEGFDIDRIATNHPGGAFGFRIQWEGKSFVHIPDNELFAANPSVEFDQFVTFCEGADVLSHDSMFISSEMPERKGWGHSCVSEVCRLGREARVQNLVLFHHAPERDDEDIDRLEVLAGSQLDGHHIQCTAAYEGLIYEF